MATIQNILSFTIFDSRGNPTIRTVVQLDNGITATSAVPSGASTGSYEAVELRDNDEQKFGGKGVTQAINGIHTQILPALRGKDVANQQEIDKIMLELDGTPNKAKLGANAILSVSQAVVKAAAISQNLPLYTYIRSLTTDKTTGYMLPTPLFNMIEGGMHADNGLNFQEYLVIPASMKSFDQKMEIGVNIFQSLKKMLREKNMSSLVADEGGFAPDLASNTDALILLKSMIERAGYQFARDAFLGMDIAANNFLDNQKYSLIDRNTPFSPQELIEYYKTLARDYSLLYMEDPLSEEDMQSWAKLHTEISSNTMVVGDDLTVTNPSRLQAAIDANAIGGIIIKPNQIGSISESIAVVEMAKFKNIKVIVSHRSGETTDDFIADFAVGVNADYAKFGAPSHERVAKYNRLIEISQELSMGR